MSSQIEKMNELHVELGRKAAEKAMAVLSSLGTDEIPVATAVALLKFGVELERKALLGAEPDHASDPFDSLAKVLAGGQSEKPEEG
jgi:hypothetical protein